jgi:GT2 family glycosyltransferase
MIDISVIIVNYNVRYFLEQCLISVNKSIKDLNVEIFVVDNDSVDNSVKVVRNKFSGVKLIENKQNLGFAKANNQAMKIAKGKYVLLLNPDTLIEEDTLFKSFEYMENNPDTGALGVKLIDGEGEFLPESKRGFPTLTSSFYRLIGLSKIFPKSKIFNQYNLGFLDEDKIAEIDVLSGAFMFVRRDILKEVGYLDEDFFMYGEDIDFSYRIKKAGYKVVYFPLTQIVHFKGESTKKSTLKYHNIFYKAMAIFAKKHYGKKGFNPLLILINLAVTFLMFFNFFKSVVKKFFLPITDFALFFLILFSVQRFWANFHFHDPSYYDTGQTSLLFIAFSLLWVTGIYFNGGYRNNHITNIIKGVFVSTFIILAFYSLLPEQIRYSRAIILISSVLIFIFLLIYRLVLNKIFTGIVHANDNIKKIAIVGSDEEVDRVKRIMDINGIDFIYAGTIIPNDKKDISGGSEYLGSIDKIEDIVSINGVDEIIFCLKNIEMKKVMDIMGRIGKNVRVKIIPEESFGIIGSSDRNSNGEFYSMEINYKFDNKNIVIFKYFFDKIIALFLLLIFPVLKFLNSKLKIVDIFQVLSGKKTWIAYVQEDGELNNLPELKKGVFTPVFSKFYKNISNNYLHDINVLYARNYNFWMDLEYLLKHVFFKVGAE